MNYSVRGHREQSSVSNGATAGAGARTQSRRRGCARGLRVLLGEPSKDLPSIAASPRDPNDETVQEVAVGAQGRYVVTITPRDFAGGKKFGFQTLMPPAPVLEIKRVPSVDFMPPAAAQLSARAGRELFCTS